MTAPSTVGRYRVIAELGRGGMGVVYRAHDPVIDREVALKTIRNAEDLPPAVFEQYRLRFLQEARAAGRLLHPAIVGVLDAGTDEASATSFIAMELVRGVDLESMLRDGVRFPPERVAQLAAAIADALACAHGQGIVHRDVKPANVLLDASGNVKVTDFGIASMADGGLTRTGQVLGSPAYMSPEQIRGQAVDARSDVFGLGVLVYELLTGKRPFPGEGLSTLTYQIVHTTPAPIDASIPAGYQRLLDRALAKQPEDRFPDAGAFAAELRRIAGGSAPAAAAAGTLIEAPAVSGSTGTVIDAVPPTVAVPPPLPHAAPPLPSAPRRGWLPLALLSASAFALAIAGLIAWWWWTGSGSAVPGAGVATPRPAVAPAQRPVPTTQQPQRDRDERRKDDGKKEDKRGKGKGKGHR